MLTVVSEILLFLAAAALLGFAVGYLVKRAATGERLEEADREFQLRLDGRDQEIHALRREADTRKTALDSLQSRLEASDAKRQEFEETVAEREARIRELRSEMAASGSAAQREIDVLRDKLHASESEMKTRAKHVADLEAELSKARQAAAARDKEIADLKGRAAQLDTVQAQLKEKEARLRDLERRGAESPGLSREIQQRDARIQELESRFQAALDAKEAEVAKLKRRISEIEGGDV
jgi:ParB family chromosome partitioning protein